MAITLRMDQGAFAIFLPFIINRLSVSISLIFVEFGAFIPELGIDGRAGVASATYVFYSAIFFLFSVFFFKALTRKSKNAPRNQTALVFGRLGLIMALGIVAVELLVIVYLLAYGASTGFPLLSGVDRFVYRRYYGSVLFLNVINLKFIFAIFLGFVCFSLRVWSPLKQACWAIFITQNALFFLFGDKFFTIASNAAFFFVPYLVERRISIGKIVFAAAPFALFLVGLLFSVTYYIYSDGFKQSSYQTFERLGERMTAQSELWFIANDDSPSLANWDGNLLSKQLDSFWSTDPDTHTFEAGLGTFYFAWKYSPMRLAISMMNNAGTTSFTMGWEPLGLVMFGYIGLGVLMIGTAFVVALGASYLKWAIASKSPISIVIASYVIVQILYMTNQGTPFVVFNIMRIKTALIFIVLEFLVFLISAMLIRRHISTIIRK
jgi:hypothetical protein